MGAGLLSPLLELSLASALSVELHSTAFPALCSLEVGFGVDKYTEHANLVNIFVVQPTWPRCLMGAGLLSPLLGQSLPSALCGGGDPTPRTTPSLPPR